MTNKEKMEKIGKEMLVVLNKEHLMEKFSSRIDNVKDIESYKSPDFKSLVRLIIYRLGKDEENLLKGIKRREEMERVLVKKKEEKMEFIEALRSRIWELEYDKKIKPFMSEVLMRLYIKGDDVLEIMEDLNISRDVVYQTKKRGLDKILGEGCLEILVLGLSIPKNYKKHQSFRVLKAPKNLEL